MLSARRRCLLLYTKPAVAGRVKTRLIGRWTAEQTAQLHAAFLADVRSNLRGGAFDLQVAWALEPEELVPVDPEGLPGWRQEGADLGARLFHGLDSAAAAYPLVAAIGSDHPELSARSVEAAFDHLAAGADMVLGPAADGGYYLIALRRGAVRSALFEGIAWSTDTVRVETEARAAALGLEVAHLPLGHDVDDAAALDALAARLATAPAGVCPHTRALLGEWGVLAS